MSPTTRTSLAEQAPAAARWLITGVRVALGWVFLWAFLDKTFGLGFATAPDNAWIAGGSPTFGYLNFATSGPLAGLFQAMAGNPVVDVLFMLGLLGVGVALLLGAGIRVAGVAGAAMMLVMWASALPPENNPVVDDHIVYALVLLLLPAIGAGRVVGLGEWWQSTELVRRYPWLA
jgi:thiosulfate dehydrogenase [quinone] large subunit